ncbi:MAG: DUF1460 domain-containing protein [Deltaproteobacteria bacterium]|nr:DUF1460 domain-containing protein [Deltaproteobacteria bacterium]
MRSLSPTLHQLPPDAPLSARIELLSRSLLGRPYLTDPLIGGPEEEERWVDRADGFDCVTFVETVLAVALRPEAPEEALRALRYRGGAVSWAERNHYAWDWFTRNEADGRLLRVLPERWIGARRTLSLLAGYPAREVALRWLPVDPLAPLDEAVQTGDLVAFISSREDLDAFHMGLLVQSTDGLLLRHASRSRGAVVEQALVDFLSDNSTPGVLVARPLPWRT